MHVKTPILGDAANGYVQTDFMFGDPEFQKFALNTGESNYKGVHRAILLASIAKAQGMKWSYKNGLMDRETNKVISKEPTMIAKRLINGTIADLSSVETIINKIKTRSDYDLEVNPDLSVSTNCPWPFRPNVIAGLPSHLIVMCLACFGNCLSILIASSAPRLPFSNIKSSGCSILAASTIICIP